MKADLTLSPKLVRTEKTNLHSVVPTCNNMPLREESIFLLDWWGQPKRGSRLL